MRREDAAATVSATVKQRAGFTIPWELIIPLIEWLIEECFNTDEQFIEAARDPSRFQMLVVHRQCVNRVRRGTEYSGRELRQASYALADAVFGVAATMGDDELQSVYKDAA